MEMEGDSEWMALNEELFPYAFLLSPSWASSKAKGLFPTHTSIFSTPLGLKQTMEKNEHVPSSHMPNTLYLYLTPSFIDTPSGRILVYFFFF